MNIEMVENILSEENGSGSVGNANLHEEEEKSDSAVNLVESNP
jgi:hypothetical protein